MFPVTEGPSTKCLLYISYITSCNTEYILVIFDIQSYGFFGLLVVHLFRRSVSFSVIRFSFYLVLRIWSNGPARLDNIEHINI